MECRCGGNESPDRFALVQRGSSPVAVHNISVHMDILFLLVPLSVGLALLILGALGWAVWRGQFESVEAEGERILKTD